MMLFAAVLLAVPLLAASGPVSESHSHPTKRKLAARWYHGNDHPVHALFRRGPTDGVAYAPIGSETWSASFPSSTPDAESLPKPWVDALNIAIQGGKIPDIPESSRDPGKNPKYPTGFDPNGEQVCSSTYQCRIAGDHWDGPEGTFASSFDDGPLPDTDSLVAFLQENKVKTTHFMIGTNILQYWHQFLTAFNAGDDIAVHTYTHPYMTTLSNTDVVAQLGWTMQLIHNSTGGRVPRFFRPPYGDSDSRVRAIAKEVFALETVIWNQDTEDWSLGAGGTTIEEVGTQMDSWLSGPKSPGLVILEHEDSTDAVTCFKNAFPKIVAKGWKFVSLAQLLGNGQAYQNSNDADSEVKPEGILSGLLNTTNITMAKTLVSSSSGTPTSQPEAAAPTVGNLANSQAPTTFNSAASVWERSSSLIWIFATALGASVMTAVTLWV
ncbi:carbohydrate esterase family 4 protein [Macrolepiota fuliginosa MF-IS2]|uniref:chitin deacetylase n=1 Tax=Macrolepiota fuliginosa MF-IS2 TaxID=1400762 RepID=A0A9P5XM94_9AGAR|nr:carbohydrate esterase family 4 protein [Macrolepiota fuliginosa MF-IS2]